MPWPPDCSLGKFSPPSLFFPPDQHKKGDREARAMLQRQLDVDILITGHTHAFEAYEYQKKFFVNPGSASGAYTPLAEGYLSIFLSAAFSIQLQRDNSHLCIDGHSGCSCDHLCVPAEKWRGQSGQNGVHKAIRIILAF